MVAMGFNPRNRTATPRVAERRLRWQVTSGVAPRRGSSVFLGPWAEAHGYLQAVAPRRHPSGTQPGRAEENSPPIRRWGGRLIPGESRRDGRDEIEGLALLPSLMGLALVRSGPPSVAPLGYSRSSILDSHGLGVCIHGGLEFSSQVRRNI